VQGLSAHLLSHAFICHTNCIPEQRIKGQLLQVSEGGVKPGSLFEVYLGHESLESKAFGFSTGHQRWGVQCSSLSRSREEFGELLGLDPYAAKLVELIEMNIGARFGHAKFSPWWIHTI
jgi:hypothetical protein